MVRPARLLVPVVVCSLVAAAYFLYPYVEIWRLDRAIAGATNPRDETDALCAANRWARAGHATYTVAARDAAGNALRPWQDGSLDRVAAVTLTWSTGQVVDRTLLGRFALDCVFGE